MLPAACEVHSSQALYRVRQSAQCKGRLEPENALLINSEALFLAKQESLTRIRGKRVTQAVRGCDSSSTAGSGRAKEIPAVAVRPGGLGAFAPSLISLHSIYSPDLLYNTPQLLDDVSGTT